MLYRVIILLFLVVIAYEPACRGGFIWDDNRYVSENQALQRPGGLWDIWFFPTATVQYYPMVFTTYWLEYRLWGLKPAGYHWVNVLLHALNAFLLWLLLRRLRIPFPWLAALIFALHPVHVESVAWITERKNVLSGFFYLSAFLAYLRFSPPEEPILKQARWGWYAVALLAFTLALFSKTVTCSLPAVLVLVYWWKRGWPTRREMVALAPMFALGLVLAMHTSRMEREFVGASGPDWNFTPIERCLIAGRALWFYVGKLLWPHPLIFNYERWHIDAHEPWQYLYPLGCLAVLAILTWPFTPLPLPKVLAPLRRLGKGPLTACLIFAGTLLPALGFFNIYPMLYYFAADHFQYLASIAMICLAMAGIQALGKIRPWIHGREGQFLAGVLLLVLACLTWMQGHIYYNLNSLWEDTRTKNPRSLLAHYNLGSKYVRDEYFEQAIECFERATAIDPHCAPAYNNWAVALRAQAEQAEAAAKRAQEHRHEAVAREYFAAAAQKYDQALQKARLAVEFDRDNTPTVLFLLASIYGAQRDYEAAIPIVEKALDAIAHQRAYEGYTKLIPDYEYALAFALLKVGRRQEALPHAQRAAELRPAASEFQRLLEEARNTK